MLKTSLISSIAGVVLVTAGTVTAQTAATAEWARFRGPNNDGTVAAPKGITDWKSATISQLWKTEMNTGFSSFAVAGGKAYTFVTREADGNSGEAVVCYDAMSGKELWAQQLAVIPKYDGGGNSGTKDNGGGDGPRSTPVINDAMVYCIDASIGVHCHDAATGKKVWDHDVMKENGGLNIKWQNAASPLIDGDILLVAGGGKGQALLGLDKKTGAVIWKGEDDQMTHATPIIADILGVHQCIFFTQTGLVAVNPQDGKVLWRGEHPYKTSTAASPVVWQDIVYCSSGYGVGASCFKITKSGDGLTAERIWRRENECFNHWSTPVVKDGFMYGMFSFKEYGAGPLACVDIRTGADKWKAPGFGPGQVILAGDKLIALSDKGEVVVVDANPETYKELKRQDVLDGKVWSYPSLAGDHLFARSTKEGVCLELK